MRELTDPGQPSLTEENQLNVGKESLGSSHALFVQACWSEHRRSPDGPSASSSGFSKKSRRARQGLCVCWRKAAMKTRQRLPRLIMKEKWKPNIRPNGKPEKSSRTPVRRSESCPKSKESPLVHPFAMKLGAMWSGSPKERRLRSWRKKHEADVTASRAKGKANAAENRVVRTEKSKKKKEEKDEEDEEEDDDEISWF